MSAQIEPSAPMSAACPLCGEQVAPDTTRCSACGYHLAGVAGRPAPFSRSALWWSAAGLLAVYLLTLLVVALAR